MSNEIAPVQTQAVAAWAPPAALNAFYQGGALTGTEPPPDTAGGFCRPFPLLIPQHSRKDIPINTDVFTDGASNSDLHAAPASDLSGPSVIIAPILAIGRHEPRRMGKVIDEFCFPKPDASVERGERRACGFCASSNPSDGQNCCKDIVDMVVAILGVNDGRGNYGQPALYGLYNLEFKSTRREEGLAFWYYAIAPAYSPAVRGTVQPGTAPYSMCYELGLQTVQGSNIFNKWRIFRVADRPPAMYVRESRVNGAAQRPDYRVMATPPALIAEIDARLTQDAGVKNALELFTLPREEASKRVRLLHGTGAPVAAQGWGAAPQAPPQGGFGGGGFGQPAFVPVQPTPQGGGFGGTQGWGAAPQQQVAQQQAAPQGFGGGFGQQVQQAPAQQVQAAAPPPPITLQPAPTPLPQVVTQAAAPTDAPPWEPAGIPAEQTPQVNPAAQAQRPPSWSAQALAAVPAVTTDSGRPAEAVSAAQAQAPAAADAIANLMQNLV